MTVFWVEILELILQHRDLKLGNFFLDAAGQIYVCDFGLAKLADSQNTALTITISEFIRISEWSTSPPIELVAELKLADITPSVNKDNVHWIQSQRESSTQLTTL